MPETVIKHAKRYEEKLDVFNQIPEMILTDRVRQDILLPVADRQIKAGNTRNDGLMLRSDNGSLVKRDNGYEPVYLETVTGRYNITPSIRVEGFSQRAEMIGFAVTARAIQTAPIWLVTPIQDMIVSRALGEPIIWLKWKSDRVYIWSEAGSPGYVEYTIYVYV